MQSCGFKSHLPHSTIRRDQAKRLVPVLLFKAEASLEPMVQGLASGSVGSWHEVPRTSLAPSSAWLRLLRGQAPHRVHRSPLRSSQNRHPPDVLQPIFRMASVVVGRVLHGSRSRLCTPSSTLKWGKLNYTDFV